MSLQARPRLLSTLRQEEIDAREQILKALDNMTPLQLVELTTILKEKFGIEAHPDPMLGVFAPVPAYGCPPMWEDQTEFTATLVETGSNKLGAMKEVRQLLTCGLLEAKTAVETVQKGQPFVLLANVSKADAEEIRHKFETLGAKVTVR